METTPLIKAQLAEDPNRHAMPAEESNRQLLDQETNIISAPYSLHEDSASSTVLPPPSRRLRSSLKSQWEQQMSVSTLH
jgi:hypothetical protein